MTKKFDLSSFALHILAMALMLCDHMWATVIPGQQWLTCVGRISYPIFAFMIVEGYFYTSNFRKYMQRLLVFALISEIPFNLMYSSSWIYPFHQNVLWTFLIGLLCLKCIDRTRAKYRAKEKGWLGLILSVLWVLLFLLLALLAMTDYNSAGVLTIVLFYFLRGDKWFYRLGQFAGLVYINWYMIKGLVISVGVFGLSFELPQQGLAVLAMLPIMLYRGRQGCHNKFVQYAFYAFYPVHLLILGLIAMLR